MNKQKTQGLADKKNFQHPKTRKFSKKKSRRKAIPSKKNFHEHSCECIEKHIPKKGKKT